MKEKIWMYYTGVSTYGTITYAVTQKVLASLY